MAPSILAALLLCSAQLPAAVRAASADPRLQSAGLVRAGSVLPVIAMSAEQERARLQRHFDAVLAMLDRDRESSLSIALARLEESTGRSWASTEAFRWRVLLSARRQRQIERLAGYQRRGLFPVNTVSNRLAPIFVDEHDTACAVGHLMRESGWTAAVDAIQARDNLVHIDDAPRGPLAAWVLTSGLTREEAALIQPTYSPPAPEAYLDELIASQGALENFSVRYSNFSFDAALIEPGLPPVSTDLVDPANFSIARYGSQLFIGADVRAGIGGLVTTPESFGSDGSELRITVGYDAESRDPTLGISEVVLSVGPQLFGCCNYAPDQSLVVETRTFFQNQEIARVIADQYSTEGILLGGGSASFAPVHKIRVETEAVITGAAAYTYFLSWFGVSPCVEDADCDAIVDSDDLCPDYPSENVDTDANEIGDACECGDQTGDGRVDIADLLAINGVIFGWQVASPLCDTNEDALCNVQDILGANAKMFGDLAHCARYPEPTEPFPFRSISGGFTGFGLGASGEERVIRDEAAWCEFWDQAHSTVDPVPPCDLGAVDFDQEVALVAAIGTRPNGCFQAAITGVAATPSLSHLEVSLLELEPGGTCLCTQALVSPVSVVAVSRPVGRVSFTHDTFEVDCSP